MAADILNNSGGTSGNQKLGTVVVNYGGRACTTQNSVEYTASNPNHNGNYNGALLTGVASITGKYDTRFDDVGYYA